MNREMLPDLKDGDIEARYSGLYDPSSSKPFHFDPRPFAKGAQNQVHFAADNWEDAKKWVLKIPLNATSNPKMRSYFHALLQSKLINFARGLTFLYKKDVKERFGEDVAIDYAECKVVKDGSGLYEEPTYFLLESYISHLKGPWIKWCNNYKYYNKELMEQHEHISALAHFIYHKTGGVIMILDLQGKFTQPGGTYNYTLSDPAFISTMDGTFGPLDFGEASMQKFFEKEKHQCNKYCQGLSKPDGPKKELQAVSGDGEGKGTLSLTLAQTNSSILKNIGANPENWRKIFKLLKGSEAGKILKETIQEVIRSSNLGDLEK